MYAKNYFSRLSVLLKSFVTCEQSDGICSIFRSTCLFEVKWLLIKFKEI